MCQRHWCGLSLWGTADELCRLCLLTRAAAPSSPAGVPTFADVELRMANATQSGLFTAGRVEWLSQGVWRTVSLGHGQRAIRPTFVEDLCVLLGFRTGHVLRHGSLGAGSLNFSIFQDYPKDTYVSYVNRNFTVRNGHGMAAYFYMYGEDYGWGIPSALAINCTNAPGEAGWDSPLAEVLFQQVQRVVPCMALAIVRYIMRLVVLLLPPKQIPRLR